MPFCSNCGTQVSDGSNFCFNCGSSIVTDVQSKSALNGTNVYERDIHKCPSCGEVLKAFEYKCKACGHEIRSVRTHSIIQEFVEELEETKFIEKKNELISNFYIPNTKEDIYDFFILAISKLATDEMCGELWKAKLEQTVHKIKLLFGNTSEYEYIEKLYLKTMNQYNSKSLNRFLKKKWKLILGLALILIGVALAVYGNFNGSGNSNSAYYMLGVMGIFPFMFGIYIIVRGINSNKNGGVFDVIKCDEQSYLIWKWHPHNVELGKSKKEYAIRTNSVLRVKDGEAAVLVYKQKDGTLQDYIVGPFDQKIKTGNFPVLSNLVGLFYQGETPFQAEIYFINLAELIQLNFAVPYFDVSDSRFPDFTVPVAVRGTLNFKIENYEKFIKCHRLINFDIETFKEQVKSSIIRYVKDVVTNIPSAHNIFVVQIESKIGMINDLIELNIKERLFEDFGVTVLGMDISAIELDTTSDAYIELKKITKDATIMSIEERAKADLEHYQESLRIQREEQQYAASLGTQSANIGAYQAGLQAEIGIAGANALGQIGANNVGNVDLSGGVGFNPMSMLASMALGSAVGQNIANTMNGGNGYNIPPIPNVVYYMAKDGNPNGPYDINKLKEMVISGEVVRNSLIWKPGLPMWVNAETIEEIKGFFPPIILQKNKIRNTIYNDEDLSYLKKR